MGKQMNIKIDDDKADSTCRTTLQAIECVNKLVFCQSAVARVCALFLSILFGLSEALEVLYISIFCNLLYFTSCSKK